MTAGLRARSLRMILRRTLLKTTREELHRPSLYPKIGTDKNRAKAELDKQSLPSAPTLFKIRTNLLNIMNKDIDGDK